LLAGEGGERPLSEALSDPGPAREWTAYPLTGKGRLVPRVPFHGRTWVGAEVRELASRLVDEAMAAEPVATALEWLLEAGVDEAGEIDLTGRRVAVLGAAAEIAPTTSLLEAGADVLWIDTAAPSEALLKDSALSGRLFVPGEPLDLLSDPRAVAATIRAFARDAAIDVGLYAYAPGQAREWRLAGAMNAIVDSLPAGSLRSVSMLISPTTPVRLRAATVAAAERRYRERPRWQRGLEAVGLLDEGRIGDEGTALVRNVVSIQGMGYQAAQYLGKTLAAERWLTVGPTGQGAPVPVSANTAAITMTRSLRHPVFETAFIGAPAFGVEAFEPDVTRTLNGLLMIADLLRPASGDADARIERLSEQQVHGGVFAMPYGIETAIRVGAVIGLARRPGRIPGFVRGLIGR